MRSQLPYFDRCEAGRILAQHLTKYSDRPDTIVLGLARGGVPVAYEIAVALNVLLDVFVVRKLGVPGHEELAMGAIASGGLQVSNSAVIAYMDAPEAMLRWVAIREQRELERREELYRKGCPIVSLEGKTVILVDDGLATGTTARVAIQAIKRFRAARYVVAVPVGSIEACSTLASEVDELVCIVTPEVFYGVGQFYKNFSQITDQEVQDLLARAAQRKNRS